MIPSVYRIANFITRRLLMPLYGSYSVSGAENVPLKGPLVVASNHLNDADPGALAWGIPRPLRFMAKVELFRIPGLRQFLLAYGAFPVRRGEADLSALRTAGEVVKAGQALVIFPEGTRSRTGDLLPFKAMPFGLAIAAGVPVVPVYVHNTFEILPKGAWRLRRLPIRVRIGDPIATAGRTLDDRDAVRDAVRAAIEGFRARVDGLPLPG